MKVVLKLSESNGKMATQECPCGFHTHPRTECTCSPSIVARYQKRISGPLLDRMDVFVEVPPVEYEKLVDEEPAEDSSHLRKRVEGAREIQSNRFKELGFLCNSEMGPAEVWKFCQLDDTAKALLQAATQRLNLSTRAVSPSMFRRSTSVQDSSGPDVMSLAKASGVIIFSPGHEHPLF